MFYPSQGCIQAILVSDTEYSMQKILVNINYACIFAYGYLFSLLFMTDSFENMYINTRVCPFFVYKLYTLEYMYI